jgi:hypothetical protein
MWLVHASNINQNKMTGQKEQKIVFGELSLQWTRSDGHAFKPTGEPRVLSGSFQRNASHSEAATVISGRTAMSCRGLVAAAAAHFILVRFYGLRPLRSGWAALP